MLVAVLFVSSGSAQGLSSPVIAESTVELQPDPNSANFIYNYETGSLSVLALWTLEGETTPEGLSAVEIQSAGSRFIPGEAGPPATGMYVNTKGLFDVYTEAKYFKLDQNGWGGGPDPYLIGDGILPTFGTYDDAKAFVETDFADRIDGAGRTGGNLAKAGGPAGGLWHIVPPIPEPTSFTLLGIGALALMSLRRKR
jgi:hypothetical protein